MSRWFVYCVMWSVLWISVLFNTTACTTPQDGQRSAEEHLVGQPDGEAAPSPAAKRHVVKRRGALWYMITKSKADAITIRMRLLKPPKRTSLFLPGPWAGRQDHARAIRIQGAFGPKGPRTWTLLRSQDRIDIDTDALPWVEFHYEVKLKNTHTLNTRFSPQQLHKGFFAYAPTIFILPSEQLARQLYDIPVEVQVPKDWRVISTWKLNNTKLSRATKTHVSHGYVVRDINTLRDAFLAADPAISHHKSKDGSVQVAFSNQFKGSKKQIAQLIETIVRGYRQRYGHLGATSVFVRTTPKQNKALWGTGRRGGFVLELNPTTALDDQLKILIAHEAFHLWNGHLLIPNPKKETKTRWFKEGLTHFVALQTLGRLGILNRRAFLSELAQAAQRYQRYTSNPNAHPNLAKRYPYDRGMVLTAALAAKLHQHSQGKATLDDWIKRLITRAKASPHWLYDNASLRRQLIDSAPTLSAILSPFWRRHVIQNKSVKIQKLFATIGLHWLGPTRTRSARLIPLAQQHPAYETIFGLAAKPKPSTTHRDL